ncbi:MAG: acetate/propionate family kinase, partial [Deltaproteobacteria bacterium]|nr:acetate/propionate family kinase [Deltaproteobacteria bacterium]
MAVIDLKTFFQSNPLMALFSDEELDECVKASEVVEFTAGVDVEKRGETHNSSWIVYDGEVGVSIPGEGVTEELLTKLEKGRIFSDMSIFTGNLVAFDYKTTKPSTLIRIPRTVFMGVVKKNPEAAMQFTKNLTEIVFRLGLYQKEHEIREAAMLASPDPYDLYFTSASEPMKISVINCGSSSLKYTIFDTTQRDPLIEGTIERIGSADAHHKIVTPKFKKSLSLGDVPNMEKAFEFMVAAVADPAVGAVRDVREFKAVGHRVAHGGGLFNGPVIIDDQVLEQIRSVSDLAPLHNPYNIEGIELFRKLLPGAKQVAVFDNTFHQTIPAAAATYALPRQLCAEERIRRYGFHGTNHEYVALNAATFLKKPLSELKIITCHLGSGASVCAIDHGRSIDTSMGMTPLEGLVMGTRPGDVDPGVIFHLLRKGKSAEELENMFNKDSGLKGISGLTNDMRELLEAAEKGDAHALDAIGVFCYRIKKYIGAYTVALGGLDVLVFTGGIGENSPEIRARIFQGFEAFGMTIDHRINRDARPERGQVVDIAEPNAKVRVLVIPADEERMIARNTLHAIGLVRSKEDLQIFKTTPVPLSISAHHIHLTQENFELLFGKGKTMTPKSPLSQPGQFAAEETVNLIGPKGNLEKVRILGPARKYSQLEISRTEQFKLGIDPPIRDSGDIEGTPGITVVGLQGQVHLEKGVICAKRH